MELRPLLEWIALVRRRGLATDVVPPLHPEPLSAAEMRRLDRLRAERTRGGGSHDWW